MMVRGTKGYNFGIMTFSSSNELDNIKLLIMKGYFNSLKKLKDKNTSILKLT
jgi:hypothetical protein